jgi:uncharacterized protein
MFSVTGRTSACSRSVSRFQRGTEAGRQLCAILRNLGEFSIFPRLIIRSSDIHAAGCFALEPVAKGTRLLEYEGERITKDEGDLRYEGRPFTYLFGIGKGDIVIDGHGMAMFVNHSCQPNCETDEIDGRVYIMAIRNIKAGEELTYDYWLYDGDDDAPCYCGSKKCRGSMYSPAELKKKKARDARKQKQLKKAAKRGVNAKGRSKFNGSALAKL